MSHPYPAVDRAAAVIQQLRAEFPDTGWVLGVAVPAAPRQHAVFAVSLAHRAHRILMCKEMLQQILQDSEPGCTCHACLLVRDAVFALEPISGRSEITPGDAP